MKITKPKKRLFIHINQKTKANKKGKTSDINPILKSISDNKIFPSRYEIKKDNKKQKYWNNTAMKKI